MVITQGEFARLALAQPEAVQASHAGKPDFRVRNKIFAGLDAPLDRAWLKLRTEIQRLMVEARPQVFVPAAGAWGVSGWTYVMLEHAELDEVRELVADAWRQVAPAGLAALHSRDAEPELRIEVASPTRRPARAAKAPGKKQTKRRSASAGGRAPRSALAAPASATPKRKRPSTGRRRAAAARKRRGEEGERRGR